MGQGRGLAGAVDTTQWCSRSVLCAVAGMTRYLGFGLTPPLLEAPQSEVKGKGKRHHR